MTETSLAFLMQATDLEAYPRQLFGSRFLAYMQAHPEAATNIIDVFLAQGDSMARSLSMTIRQEISAEGD